MSDRQEWSYLHQGKGPLNKTSSEFMSKRAGLNGYTSTLKNAMAILESSGYNPKTHMKDILADKEIMERFKEELLSPLVKMRDKKNVILEGYGHGASGNDKTMVAIKESVDIIDQDIAFASERIGEALRLIQENWSVMNMPYHAVVTLPYLYLDSIACTGRHVIPMQNAAKQRILRQRSVTMYKIMGIGEDDISYEAPGCLLDKVFLDKVLSTSTGNFFSKMDLTDTTAFKNGKYTLNSLGTMAGEVFTESTDNPIAGKKIYDNIRIAYIKVNDGTVDKMIKIKEDPDQWDGVATLTNKGKATYEVKLDTDVYMTINISVNFETKVISITQSIPAGYTLLEMYASIVMRNHNFAKYVTSYKQNKDVTSFIKQRIDQGIEYDEEQRLDMSEIHNIDMIADTYAGMAIMTQHIKDHFIFDTIDKQVNALKAIADSTDEEFETGIIGFKEDYREMSVSLKPADNSYYPQDKYTYKSNEIAKHMQFVDAEIKRIFNSQKGLQTTWIMHPEMAPFVENPTVVIGKGENYGGTTSNEQVMNVSVGGIGMKVVYSERADNVTRDLVNNKSTIGVKCVPYALDENMETRSFKQFRTYLDADGVYRSPLAPALQQIKSSDMFDIFSYQSVGGQLLLSDIYQ